MGPQNPRPRASGFEDHDRMKAEGFTLYCADPLRMPPVEDSSVQIPLALLWRAELKLDRGSPSTKRGRAQCSLSYPFRTMPVTPARKRVASSHPSRI
jgi:hypothetical protein